MSARTVLACLALARGSVVGVGHLCEALWEDNPPDKAIASLQSVVSRLRSGLGPDTIQTTGSGYRLAKDFVSTDIWELESTLADLDCSDPASAAARLEQVLDAWDGAALGDVAFTSWFAPDRTRLDELRLTVGERRSELLVAAGRPEEVLGDLQRDAAASPLRETTVTLLVRALHMTGRNAEALRAASRYRRDLAEETGLEPSPVLVALEREILTFAPPAHQTPSEGPPPQEPGRTRWIPPDTPFVGRESELRTLEKHSGVYRLVSVVGPGGVGKSRLVMEYLSGGHRRCVVVLLASLEPGADVELALADELGLEPTAGSPLPMIVDRLRMNPTTIVFDNCEHVLGSVRRLVRELLGRVNGLTVLSTSRRRLGLPEECTLQLDPLAVPSLANVHSPAVALFVDRVERSSSQVHLGAKDTPVVTDVCRLLGGLPLALELAAARVHMLGLDELRTQLLRGRLPQGEGGATMDDTVRWSLELLGEDARVLFGELCVFPARFALDAVEAVSSLDAPMAALAELVDASLVGIEGDASCRAYRILEPIRQVGAQAIPQSAVRAYLDWVRALGDEIDSAWSPDERHADVHRRIAMYQDDFKHVFALLTEAGEDARVGRLARQLAFPLAQRPSSELVGLIWNHSPENADGLVARAELAWVMGKPEQAIRCAEEVLRMVDDDERRAVLALTSMGPASSYVGDVDQMAWSGARVLEHPAAHEGDRAYGAALWALAEYYRGDAETARRLLVDNADVLDLSAVQGFVPFVRGEIAAGSDTAEALRLLEQGSEEARSAGSFLLGRMVEVALLALLVESGERLAAANLARRHIPELLEAGVLPQAWMSLRNVAALLQHEGELDVAARILDAARASRDATELVGEAIDAEAALRQRIQDELDRTRESTREIPVPMSAGELWPEVEAALRRVS